MRDEKSLRNSEHISRGCITNYTDSRLQVRPDLVTGKGNSSTISSGKIGNDMIRIVISREYIPDSGENIEQVMKRMNEFFEECVERHEKGRVLIVSHGVAIRALLLTLLHWPIEKLWDFNEIVGASVTKIVVNSKGIDVEYIGKELTDMTNS